MPVIAEFAVPQEQLLEIIDGMEMDLQQSRYLDFKALSLYCYRVASVVGLLAAEIFGYQDRKTLEVRARPRYGLPADQHHPRRRRRCTARAFYLPMDELKRFEVPVADILNARHSDNFRKLMEFQIERAEQFYAQAMSMLPAG